MPFMISSIAIHYALLSLQTYTKITELQIFPIRSNILKSDFQISNHDGRFSVFLFFALLLSLWLFFLFSCRSGFSRILVFWNLILFTYLYDCLITFNAFQFFELEVHTEFFVYLLSVAFLSVCIFFVQTITLSMLLNIVNKSRTDFHDEQRRKQQKKRNNNSRKKRVNMNGTHTVYIYTLFQ